MVESSRSRSWIICAGHVHVRRSHSAGRYLGGAVRAMGALAGDASRLALTTLVNGAPVRARATSAAALPRISTNDASE